MTKASKVVLIHSSNLFSMKNVRGIMDQVLQEAGSKDRFEFYKLSRDLDAFWSRLHGISSAKFRDVPFVDYPDDMHEATDVTPEDAEKLIAEFRDLYAKVTPE